MDMTVRALREKISDDKIVVEIFGVHGIRIEKIGLLTKCLGNVLRNLFAVCVDVCSEDKSVGNRKKIANTM